jgi:hypothetical protein
LIHIFAGLRAAHARDGFGRDPLPDAASHEVFASIFARGRDALGDDLRVGHVLHPELDLGASVENLVALFACRRVTAADERDSEGYDSP